MPKSAYVSHLHFHFHFHLHLRFAFVLCVWVATDTRTGEDESQMVYTHVQYAYGLPLHDVYMYTRTHSHTLTHTHRERDTHAPRWMGWSPRLFPQPLASVSSGAGAGVPCLPPTIDCVSRISSCGTASSCPIALQETGHFLPQLSFHCACPEPVLVKSPCFMLKSGRNDRFSHLMNRGWRHMSFRSGLLYGKRRWCSPRKNADSGGSGSPAARFGACTAIVSHTASTNSFGLQGENALGLYSTEFESPRVCPEPVLAINDPVVFQQQNDHGKESTVQFHRTRFPRRGASPLRSTG